MSGRSVRRPLKKLDPIFTIPDGVDELVWDTDSILDGEAIVTDEILIDDGNDLDESPLPDIVETPTDFAVVSQTVRTLADGRQVVDVVIAVEEVSGAINYDFRVTKSADNGG